MSTAVEQKLDFTMSWFHQHQAYWERLHGDIVQGHDKFLEVGSFEGMSACWMLQHSLSPAGKLWCIDTWEGSPEIKK